MRLPCSILLQNDLKNKTDFEISKILRTPESKIKRLRYEVNLYYGNQDDKTYDNDLLLQLKNGSFKLTADRIQFAINDKMLRQYLNNKLQKQNRFADSSFNSSIVSVTADDLQALVNDIEIDENKRKEIILTIKGKTQESLKSLPPTVKEKIVAFSKTIMNIVGGKALEKLINDSFEELKKGCNSLNF